MQLRSILGAAVATLLLCGTGQATGLADKLPSGSSGGLPGVFPVQGQAPVILAQTTNQALDEQLARIPVEERKRILAEVQVQIQENITGSRRPL